MADTYSYGLKFMYKSGIPHVGVQLWLKVISLKLLGTWRKDGPKWSCQTCDFWTLIQKLKCSFSIFSKLQISVVINF